MGGMSTVFEAETGDGQRVALKLLHPSMTIDSLGRERLRREVRMLQQVKGPYVAEVLDAETEDDDAFVVTELIDGPTLENDVAENGVFSGEDLAQLALQLRDAVDSIHSVGVLHRDIKPSNVMMAANGPVLIDFGLAQFDDDVRLTTPGSLTHTPGYCDPKVLSGAAPDEDADWWALAAVVAYAATGQHPFGTGAAPAIMRRVIDGAVEIPGLSRRLTAAFTRALAPQPESRISFDELIDVLEDPDDRPEDTYGQDEATGDQDESGLATVVVNPPHSPDDSAWHATDVSRHEIGASHDVMPTLVDTNPGAYTERVAAPGADDIPQATAPVQSGSAPLHPQFPDLEQFPDLNYAPQHNLPGTYSGAEGLGYAPPPAMMPGGFGLDAMGMPQEVPAWARPAPKARLLTLLAGAAVVALSARWPLCAIALYFIFLWIAGAVGISAVGLRERRLARGAPYKGERAGVATTSSSSSPQWGTPRTNSSTSPTKSQETLPRAKWTFC